MQPRGLIHLINRCGQTSRVSKFIRGSVFLTSAAGFLGQIARPLISLVTLPLLLAYLGTDGLGIWLIALSLIGLIGFVGAGLSASIVTSIGRADADPSGLNVQRITTAATAIAICWGLLVLAVAVPSALALDWAWLLSLETARYGRDVSYLMAALASMLAFSLLANVPKQIMIGRLHGYVAHLLDFVGVIAGALGLILALNFDAPLWILGLVFMGPTIAMQLTGGLFYLRRAGIPLFSRQNIDRDTFRFMGKDSLRMAGYQSAYAVSSQSDLLLIGIMLGAPASAVYGIAQRVFSLLILLMSTVNYAQWPAMARADAAGETEPVSRMFRLTLIIGSAVTVTAAIAIALIYEPLIHIWLGRTIETDPLILIGMVAWVLVATLVLTCDSLLRARQKTNLLMRCMMVMAVINIATTLALLPLIGPAGAIWGSVTGHTFALLLPYIYYLRGDLGWTSRRFGEIS